ncbi:MAG: hypothetical protein HY964_09025 [Ignavibacteriales bacterium]|nr:hypothetical protein [Ignavibacteriales bacterium]
MINHIHIKSMLIILALHLFTISYSPASQKQLDISLQANRDSSSVDGIRLNKPFGLGGNISLGSALFTEFTVSKQFTTRYAIKVNIVYEMSILNYQAAGISLENLFYLPPDSYFQPYLAVGCGFLLRPDHEIKTGILFSARFGWDYFFEERTHLFFAIGPQMTFFGGGKNASSMLQVGVIYNIK